MLFRTINITATSFIYKETSKPFVFQPAISSQVCFHGQCWIGYLKPICHSTYTDHKQHTLRYFFFKNVFSQYTSLLTFLSRFLLMLQKLSQRVLFVQTNAISEWGYTLVSGKDYKGAILSSVAPKAVSCISSEKSVCDLQLNISTIGSQILSQGKLFWIDPIALSLITVELNLGLPFITDSNYMKRSIAQ